MTRLWIFLTLLLFVLGCAPQPHVAFVNNNISRVISVEGVRERNVGQLKEIEVYGENKSGEYMKFRYRVVWKDKDGFEIPSLSAQWTEFSVYEKTPYQFSTIAPSIDAAEYMVYINKDKKCN